VVVRYIEAVALLIMLTPNEGKDSRDDQVEPE